MVHVIEWDITGPKGDYTQDHNHKIKRALKLMAPTLYPEMTLAFRLCAYLEQWAPTLELVIIIESSWLQVQKIDPLVKQIASLLRAIDYKGFYQLVQLIRVLMVWSVCVYHFL